MTLKTWRTVRAPHLRGQLIDLPLGGLLRLERFLPYDIEGLEDSALLLNLAF
jgi:hypothetical protein